MSVWNTTRPILVTCPKGLAPYLTQEILGMKLPVREEGPAAVETQGTLVDTIRLNLSLRTAQHVLFLVAAVQATHCKELYAEARRIAWEDYVPSSGYLSVRSWVDNPSVHDTRIANLTCKDAIVDRLRKATGRRPDSGPAKKGAVVFLYWKGHHCRLYVDTSGEPLSKRGYRKIPLRAPMQESLAAAVVMATGWDGTGPFVNPMCGSATLAIEACLLALGRGPGLLRHTFGFMHLKGFDPIQYGEIRKSVRRCSRPSFKGLVIASDKDPRAVEAARKHAVTAGVHNYIEFLICDFADTRIPRPEGTAVVVLNPPYGKRLGDTTGLATLYARIGDFLKQKCQGYRGYIFTGSIELAKQVGLRTRRRIHFYNGPVACRLLEYDIYPGSQKQRNQ